MLGLFHDPTMTVVLVNTLNVLLRRQISSLHPHDLFNLCYLNRWHLYFSLFLRLHRTHCLHFLSPGCVRLLEYHVALTRTLHINW